MSELMSQTPLALLARRIRTRRRAPSVAVRCAARCSRWMRALGRGEEVARKSALRLSVSGLDEQRNEKCR